MTMCPSSLDLSCRDHPPDAAEKPGDHVITIERDDTVYRGFEPDRARISWIGRNVNEVRAFLDGTESLVPERVEVSGEGPLAAKHDEKVDVGGFPGLSPGGRAEKNDAEQRIREQCLELLHKGRLGVASRPAAATLLDVAFENLATDRVQRHSIPRSLGAEAIMSGWRESHHKAPRSQFRPHS